MTEIIYAPIAPVLQLLNRLETAASNFDKSAPDQGRKAAIDPFKPSETTCAQYLAPERVVL